MKVVKLAAVILASLLLISGCNEKTYTPTAPSSMPESSLPLPTPTATPTVTSTPASESGVYGSSITDDGEFAYSQMCNSLSKSEDFVLACYQGNMLDLDEQYLVGHPQTVRLAPGECADFVAPLACGVQNQCDNLFNVKTGEYKQPPHAAKTINHRVLKADDCAPPPRKKCTKPPEPECAYGPAIYDPVTCTWTCPPPSECITCEDATQSISCMVDTVSAPTLTTIPAPDILVIRCTAQASHEGYFTSDFGPSGSFIGTKEFSATTQCGTGPFMANVMNRDTTCNDGSTIQAPGVLCGSVDAAITIPACQACPPMGKPDCPEQKWDVIECKWVGECPACPVPKPEPQCQEQTWLDYPDCKWVGECPCQPTEAPPCAQYCTWDTINCLWVCNYPECDFGYEFDLESCSCKPRMVCHISNGGQPGECDFNLQESPKKFNPGHGMHMDPANQCPPDYFMPVEGCATEGSIYDIVPHPCMAACQQ